MSDARIRRLERDGNFDQAQAERCRAGRHAVSVPFHLEPPPGAVLIGESLDYDDALLDARRVVRRYKLPGRGHGRGHGPRLLEVSGVERRCSCALWIFILGHTLELLHPPALGPS